MTQVSPPPTKEVGYEAAVPTGVASRPGLPSWAMFAGNLMDPLEDVPQLAWPQNVRVYHKMRTDAQIDALIKAVTLPMRRLNYFINPNGARDEVVADLSQQYNLPILGDNDAFIQRGRRRFNFKEHLRMALLGPLVYGHMPFEMVGDIIADSLLWNLRKLAPRMPQTIMKFDVARDGGLNAIIQYDPTNMHGLPIPITQLAMYSWEQEGGNWAGRSMMRPLYKFWTLKDRMLRIDAIKNERFGAGIPTGTAPQGGDPADYQKLASSIRASENGGVGLPDGADIGVNGIRGTLPDTLASIRMYDEQMARSFLAMFMQLGQTETGSRALGESFVDFFEDSIWGFVEWFADIFDNHVSADIVDWNWGQDENVPLLTAVQDDETPLAATDLANMARAGVLVMDEELQKWVRKRFHMPEYDGGQPLPTRPGTVVQDEPGATDPLPATASRRHRVVVRSHQAGGHDQKSHGRGNSKIDEPATPEADTDVEVPAGHKAKVTFVRGKSQTYQNPTVGHRDPTEIEIRATVDFNKIQQVWEKQLDKLVAAWGKVNKEQINALVDAVEQAVVDDDLIALASIEAPVLGTDVLMKHMTEAAASAIDEAAKEAARQGVTLSKETLASISDDIAVRAEATATMLANSIAGSASRNAIQRYAPGVAPEDVANGVRARLESLSGAYRDDQLGGALTQAQNVGRLSVMSQDETVEVYASELLDNNTCEFCADNDGNNYGSDMDAATADYPAGGFVDCDGGPRCRGTLVAVYGESGDSEELS